MRRQGEETIVEVQRVEVILEEETNGRGVILPSLLENSLIKGGAMVIPIIIFS